ncbi:MAG: tetratricopeptide repeat protein [bacterium]|nr:tetratricopeptide repeat protein [bacterium]
MLKKVVNGRTLIVIAILIIVILFGGVGTFVVENAKTRREVSKQLSLGDNFLEELNYEQAILAYKKAITIDDKSVETYKKLAVAYKANEEIEKAMDTLRKGYNETNEKSLKDLLAVYEEIQEHEKQL